MNSSKISLLAAVLAVPFAFTACGGGGGGGGGGGTSGGGGGTASTTYTGATITPTIDSSNADDAAAKTVESASSAGGNLSTGSNFAGVLSGSSDGGQLSAASAGMDMFHKMQNTLSGQAASGVLVAGATTDLSPSFCASGGSATLTYPDSWDTSGTSYGGTYSKGDTLTLSFSNCTQSGGNVWDGSLGFTFNQPYDTTSTTSAFDMTISYNSLSISDSSACGGVCMGADGTYRFMTGTYTADYNGGAGMPHQSPAGDSNTIVGTPAGALMVANIDVVDNTNGRQVRLRNAELWFKDADNDLVNGVAYPVYLAFHGTGSSAGTNTYKSCQDGLGCVKISHSGTDTFRFDNSTDSYPAAGKMKVVGASGSSVTLDADTGDVTTVHLTTSDGTTDKTVPWTDLTKDKMNSLLNNV